MKRRNIGLETTWNNKSLSSYNFCFQFMFAFQDFLWFYFQLVNYNHSKFCLFGKTWEWVNDHRFLFIFMCELSLWLSVIKFQPSNVSLCWMITWRKSVDMEWWWCIQGSDLNWCWHPQLMRYFLQRVGLDFLDTLTKSWFNSFSCDILISRGVTIISEVWWIEMSISIIPYFQLGKK